MKEALHDLQLPQKRLHAGRVGRRLLLEHFHGNMIVATSAEKHVAVHAAAELRLKHNLGTIDQRTVGKLLRYARRCAR